MTRKILWLPLLSAVCGFTSLRADLTIVERVDGGTGNGDRRTIMLKANRIREDILGGYSFITDYKTGEEIDMMHGSGSYIDMAFGIMKPPAAPKDGGTVLRPTGKKKTISGYAAEEYAGAFRGIEMTMWLTRAIPDYANVARQMPPAFSAGLMGPILTDMRMDAAKLPGFPLRTECKWAPGARKFPRTVIDLPGLRETDQLPPVFPTRITIAVLSVSTRPIADSKFQPPADYRPIH